MPKKASLSSPPHSYGEVSASYADGGVRSISVPSPMTPPSGVTATPPHLNGEEKAAHG